MSAWGDFIERLYGFSLLPTRDRRKRRLAIELVLWSALSGLIYSAILVYIDQVDTVYLAIGYVIFSFVNLYIYYLFRGYQFFQLSQLVLLLALPILNQFMVGGYVNSGANVVSTILAPIGALFFLDHKKGKAAKL